MAEQKEKKSIYDIEVLDSLRLAGELYNKLRGGDTQKMPGPSNEIHDLWFDNLLLSNRQDTIFAPQPVFMDALSPGYLTGALSNFFGAIIRTPEDVHENRKMHAEYMGSLKERVLRDKALFGEYLKLERQLGELEVAENDRQNDAREGDRGQAGYAADPTFAQMIREIGELGVNNTGIITNQTIAGILGVSQGYRRRTRQIGGDQ